MPKYRTWVDARKDPERREMRKQTPKDIGSGTMRLALHLSDTELQYLELMNPDTLGHPDSKVHDAEWGRFINHPESSPYRVNKT